MKDNGIGIPPERIEGIFEPFHQLNGSSTRKYGDTGLGLNLAQKIVNAHGSKIHVTSVLGEGSEFMFSLISDKDTIPYQLIIPTRQQISSIGEQILS